MINLALQIFKIFLYYIILIKHNFLDIFIIQNFYKVIKKYYFKKIVKVKIKYETLSN